MLNYKVFKLPRIGHFYLWKDKLVNQQKTQIFILNNKIAFLKSKIHIVKTQSINGYLKYIQIK